MPDAEDIDVFRLDVHGAADFEVRTSRQTDTTGGAHLAHAGFELPPAARLERGLAR